MAETEQGIIKTGKTGNIRIQSDSQFLIPFGCSNKILGCKWINGDCCKTNGRCIDMNQLSYIILVVIRINRQIVFTIRKMFLNKQWKN